ncbi:MAG: CDP-diacylglycerol--glycerol-3-phosphate 3-phosphatidyltransferase [Proteobacteria bacterium]|nr:CDP-diacylglycerol--glycerol-3-phosphate 3-phosphatidyltransferase [Pseudomonadota bacterium]
MSQQPLDNPVGSASAAHHTHPKHILWKNVPNYLTLFRLGLVPIFVLLMVEPSEGMVLFAIAVFIIAAITDYVDGIIARSFGATSDFGKLLDPLVDKVLVMAALVMLATQRSDVDGAPWVPGWMVVLVLAREIWVTGLRAVAATQGLVVGAKAAGKVKSGFQMVAIVFLLLHSQEFNFLGRMLTCQIVGLNLLFVSIIFSYWGAYEYTHEILLKDKEQRSGTSAAG